MIEKRLNEVDYVVYMPDRCKQRRVCHINMLKEYCKSTSSPSIVPVAIVVGLKDDSMMNEGSASADVKLTNSDVLANLHQKLGHLSVGERESMVSLINKFQELFTDVPKKTNVVLHDVDVGDAKPCKQHPYRVNPLKVQHMEREIKYMLENDIIEPSSSEWSSACILVPKPDGNYRFCTDFCKLNSVTKTDSFPILRIDDCIEKIGRARFVSKLDLLKGY